MKEVRQDPELDQDPRLKTAIQTIETAVVSKTHIQVTIQGATAVEIVVVLEVVKVGAETEAVVALTHQEDMVATMEGRGVEAETGLTKVQGTPLTLHIGGDDIM